MATKKQNGIPLASNVEKTTVNGRTVWRVHSAKSGRVVSVTAKSSSKRSMERVNARYDKALQSLADR